MKPVVPTKAASKPIDPIGNSGTMTMASKAYSRLSKSVTCQLHRNQSALLFLRALEFETVIQTHDYKPCSGIAASHRVMQRLNNNREMMF